MLLMTHKDNEQFSLLLTLCGLNQAKLWTCICFVAALIIVSKWSVKMSIFVKAD